MESKKVKGKNREGISKYFDTRKGAFRGFRKDYDVPKTEQPQKVVSPDSRGGKDYELDERNKRLYIFGEKRNKFGQVKRRETQLREDKDAFYAGGKGNQDQHFNAGHSGDKLKDHYYFKKKRK